MNGEPKAIDYRFFLSYSRRDAKEQGQKENAWFTRFRENLVRDVAREAKLPDNVPEDQVGFYDRQGIDLGNPWRTALLDALQQSRVLICLYSQNYFLSEYCGKEFEVFLRRQAQNPTFGVRIIPVLWDAPRKLPEPLPHCVAEAQFTHKSLGDVYAEKGVLHLLRMAMNHEYQKFLEAVAEKIARAGETILPPARGLGPIDQIGSAFHPVPSPAAAARTPAPQGVKAALMVYVAGAATDYETRTNRKAYGAASFEWQPYHPDSEAMAGALGPNVVSSRGLFPGELPVTADLSTKLQEAEDKNTMVLILVDPWAVEIATFSQVFASVDRIRLSNCGVIIPWSPNDPELGEIDPDAEKANPSSTRTRREVLQGRLLASLSHIWNDKDVVFVKRVESEESFKLALGQAIDAIRKRISDRGRLLRGEASPEDLPTLPPGTASVPANELPGGKP